MNEKNDTTFLKNKVDKLNKQAWDVRVNNLISGFNLSKQAIEHSEKINYAKGKAEGFRIHAFCIIRLSKYLTLMISAVGSAHIQLTNE
jgi:hypothetical protein